MRYVLDRLKRTPTALLAAFVTLGDLALFLGVLPLELYLRGIIAHHRNDVAFLLTLLGANLLILLFLFSIMTAAGVIFARGARRVARVALPIGRKRTK